VDDLTPKPKPKLGYSQKTLSQRHDKIKKAGNSPKQLKKITKQLVEEFEKGVNSNEDPQIKTQTQRASEAQNEGLLTKTKSPIESRTYSSLKSLKSVPSQFNNSSKASKLAEKSQNSNFSYFENSSSLKISTKKLKEEFIIDSNTKEKSTLEKLNLPAIPSFQLLHIKSKAVLENLPFIDTEKSNRKINKIIEKLQSAENTQQNKLNLNAHQSSTSKSFKSELENEEARQEGKENHNKTFLSKSKLAKLENDFDKEKEKVVLFNLNDEISDIDYTNQSLSLDVNEITDRKNMIITQVNQISQNTASAHNSNAFASAKKEGINYEGLNKEISLTSSSRENERLHNAFLKDLDKKDEEKKRFANSKSSNISREGSLVPLEGHKIVINSAKEKETNTKGKIKVTNPLFQNHRSKNSSNILRAKSKKR
jgi:hypothetical protein